MQARLELAAFPAEVILRVFCSLSTFPDILNFAATCQKHRQIFHNNVSTIYHYVSPMAIPCRCYARELLADQGGSLPNETLTAVQDFLQMTRNSIVMEKSIVHFNETVVIKMTHTRRAHKPGDKRFFDGNSIRPPYLTERERPRFIRGAYQLWSLVLLDPVLRELRISTLKYKDIYTLMDLAQLQFWAGGVLILDKEVMEIEKVEVGLVEHLGLHDLRTASTRIVEKYYHEGRKHLIWGKEYGWMGCISIWENWVEEFEESGWVKGCPGRSINLQALV